VSIVKKMNTFDDDFVVLINPLDTPTEKLRDVQDSEHPYPHPFFKEEQMVVLPASHLKDKKQFEKIPPAWFAGKYITKVAEGQKDSNGLVVGGCYIFDRAMNALLFIAEPGKKGITKSENQVAPKIFFKDGTFGWYVKKHKKKTFNGGFASVAAAQEALCFCTLGEAFKKKDTHADSKKSSGIMDEDDASGCKVVMHNNVILYGDMCTNDVEKTAESKNGHGTHEDSCVRVPASVLSAMPSFKDLPAEWFEDKYLWQFTSGSRDEDGIDNGGMFVQDHVVDAYMYLAMNSPNYNKVEELPLPKNIVYKDGLFGWSTGIHSNKQCSKGFKSIAEAETDLALFLEHGDCMDIVRIVDKDKMTGVPGNPLTVHQLVETVPASFLISCKGFEKMPEAFFDGMYLKIIAAHKDEKGNDIQGSLVLDDNFWTILRLVKNSKEFTKKDNALPKHIFFHNGSFGWKSNKHKKKTSKAGFQSIAEAQDALALHLSGGASPDVGKNPLGAKQAGKR